MATTTKATYTEVEKVGDWAIPVKTKEGVIVYALQVNKTQEEKDNWLEIEKEYNANNIEVMHYFGKNNSDVFLVDATQKLKKARVSATTEEMVAEMVALGVSEEIARKAISNAKAKKTQAKSQ